MRGGGLGLPTRARPDYGDGWWELECPGCGASWVGAMFDTCGWCERALERQQVDQRLGLLRPDLPDVHDARHADALAAWAGRLRQAVRGGIVTEAEADRAWGRCAS